MGSPSATSGGRTDAGPNRTTATKIGVGNITESGKKTPLYKSDNPDAFRNRGAENIKKLTKKVPTPSLLIASKPLQAGSKVTRDFFTDKVLGSKNFKNVTKEEFLGYDADKQEMMYGSYIGNRTSGRTDAYGNDISRDGRTGQSKKSIEQPKVASQMDNSEVKSDLITADKTAPTTVEMANAELTDDERMLKVKRGKKTKTVLTDITGLKGQPTLSQKALLG